MDYLERHVVPPDPSVRELIVLGAHGLSVLGGLGPLCGGGPTSCL
jgi:hypothetical protein